MNYRKIFDYITLIAWSTIAVIFFMCAIKLHTAEANSLFKPAVNYGVGNSSFSVAIGDLDGDGDLDLVTDGVTVLLGNGDGTFQTAVNYAAAGESVAIGDLDGDGDLDLVTDYVSVLLGNGDGTFQTAVNYGSGGHSVDIGDLNGDGDLDLAVGGGLKSLGAVG